MTEAKVIYNEMRYNNLANVKPSHIWGSITYKVGFI